LQSVALPLGYAARRLAGRGSGREGHERIAARAAGSTGAGFDVGTDEEQQRLDERGHREAGERDLEPAGDGALAAQLLDREERGAEDDAREVGAGPAGAVAGFDRREQQEPGAEDGPADQGPKQPRARAPLQEPEEAEERQQQDRDEADRGVDQRFDGRGWNQPRRASSSGARPRRGTHAPSRRGRARPGRRRGEARLRRMAGPLEGKVALVAGATRGAGRGIAVQLGAAGATVYCTGRSTRASRSEMDRPETIEETAELVDAAGGRGIAVQVDHLVPDEVRELVARIAREHGALHVLVNDIWGATRMEWNKTVWESDLELGLRTLRLGVDTHAITSHFALPLLIRNPGGLVVEVNDGTAEYNARTYRVSFFYDLAKACVTRMAFSLAHELKLHGATAVSLTPGWLRSEQMLEDFGVTEANWRDATARIPHFAISESPAFVGRAVAALAADPYVSRWSGRALSSGQLARVYGFTDLDGSQPDAWRYVPEVQDAGKPADVRGYR
jgi:NAD(P)-dependent dehydrogenase (short-subunit alcohol dehydrogenase family)